MRKDGANKTDPIFSFAECVFCAQHFLCVFNLRQFLHPNSILVRFFRA